MWWTWLLYKVDRASWSWHINIIGAAWWWQPSFATGGSIKQLDAAMVNFTGTWLLDEKSWTKLRRSPVLQYCRYICTGVHTMSCFWCPFQYCHYYSTNMEGYCPQKGSFLILSFSAAIWVAFSERLSASFKVKKPLWTRFLLPVTHSDWLQCLSLAPSEVQQSELTQTLMNHWMHQKCGDTCPHIPRLLGATQWHSFQNTCHWEQETPRRFSKPSLKLAFSARLWDCQLHFLALVSMVGMTDGKWRQQSLP